MECSHCGSKSESTFEWPVTRTDQTTQIVNLCAGCRVVHILRQIRNVSAPGYSRETGTADAFKIGTAL